MALFVFLIKGWYKDAQFSLASYIVGALLFILLSFQCILITGSLKIISDTDYYELQFQRVVERDYPPLADMSLRQADDVIKEVISEYPILKYYISGGTFSGFQAYNLPHALASELASFMRWYIFRRILWCLAFVVIGAIIVIKTMSRSRPKVHQSISTREKRTDRRVERRRTRR